MKQKILIRVSMTDDKTRARAMQTAVQFKGVSAVEIKGDHMNQIEVTGVEVDMICLTNTLRRKVAFAELVSVNKVEPPKKPDEEKKPEGKKPDEKKEEEKKPEPCHLPWPYYGYGVPSSYPHPCDPYGYTGRDYTGRDYTGEPVYNQEPNCRIM
uniref:HMA domain-containing protein n=1 Tax=Noccaea caerulescens TaxID=107243 RepID=A0A1J3FCF9_NOCCA